MANLGFRFNATEVEPTSTYELIPEGDYLAIITDSEVKETKARTGFYLQLTFDIIDDNSKGRKVWARLNIQNKNKTAEEIGQRELSSVCHAVGHLGDLDDTDVLHNIPLIIGVESEERSDKEGSYSNVIKTYKAAGGSKPAAVASKPKAEAPASSGDATPPWKKGK
jgi:hypothetical protein